MPDIVNVIFIARAHSATLKNKKYIGSIIMNFRPSRVITAGAVALGITLSAGMASAQEAKSYILSTASTGGTYYPVGVALATLTKVKLEPKTKIGMSAISSAGSGENVKLLRDGEAQFAILQGLFGYYAATGTGPVAADGPQTKLRSISMLWQNVEHYIVAADKAKTGTMADFVALKGEAVAMGAKNSGTIGSNRTILSGFGLDMDKDFELMYGGYGPSVSALQDGKIAGVGVPGGVPVGALVQLMSTAGDSVKMLSMTEDEVKKADNGRGLWVPYTIPANSYPGQTTDIQTVAQPNFLATTADIPEEDVYQITKTIFENLGFLNAIHAATKAMAIDKATGGLPVPLHPGAARYYKEVGITIPDHLIAK